MKTKKYVVEVVSTTEVEITLPERYFREDVQKDWESFLWELEGDTPEEKAQDIAKYAARMAVLYPNCGHDGIGRMIEDRFTKPDYEINPDCVVAITLSEEDESEILSIKGDI